MNLLEKTLDYIFTPICGICGKIDTKYLCDNCKNSITNSNLYLNQLQIYNYENINKNDKYNNNENKNKNNNNNKNSNEDNKNIINEHFYIFSYTGIIRQKIIEYKFQDKPYLSKTFYEFFVKNEKLCGFLKKYDIIISVPISKQKNKNRGYNQSELIARKIAKTGLIQFEKKLLIKVKNNKSQSTLNKCERLKNVKNVYKVQNEQKIIGKNIIIFDDIYTTGATVQECAKVLKNAGAKNIGILTIAKDFKKI